MKTKLQLFLNTGIIVSVLAFMPVAVFAQGTEAETENNTVTTQTTEQEEQPDPAKVRERVNKRKIDQKTRLNFAAQTRIKTNCKASQGKLSNISGRIKGLETSRSQVYKNLTARLTNLNDKLKEKGVVTTEFEAQIAELQVLTETFDADLVAYQAAVSDLATMDCASDPTGFQASLDDARASRTRTADSAKAIRTQLQDVIKPILKELKSQVEKEAQNEAQEGEEE